MLNLYDATKLKNDLKLMIRANKVVAEENNDSKRLFAMQLVEDIGNRIMNDIDEMTEGFIQSQEYDGSSKLEK